MHAKPDLRVFLKWMIAGSGSVIADVIRLKPNSYFRNGLPLFHGQPYCQACDYEGPSFMWSYHHHAGLWILLQDTETKELRTVNIPDRDGLRDTSLSDDELDALFEQDINTTFQAIATSSEILIDVSKIALAPNDEPIVLECPQCNAKMYWRHTGIS